MSLSSKIRTRMTAVALKGLLPLLVLVLAGGMAFSIVTTSPQPERQSQPRHSRLVETIDIALTRETLTIEAWGHVQPAQQITLRPQVSGEIVAVNPELVPGGRFSKHDTILRLDPSDYALAVRQRQTDLAKARAELLLEEGNQVVAKQEFDLLGESIKEQEKALVLRLPQLNEMQADVDAAAAALQTAKLALSRTVIKTPFDATVLRRHVDIGTYVTPTTDLVTLAGTQVYWVELAIPMAQLKWINIPFTPKETGSLVKLYQDAVWGKEKFRIGRVIRLLTDLEPEGRMARVLVAIEDPLNYEEPHLNQPPLLLGSYLRAEIQGQEIDQLASIDRRWVRDRDTVWLMKDDDTLEIRPVHVAYRGRYVVFISEGLQTGDRLIVTDMASPAEGMPLRTANSSDIDAPGYR